MSNLELDQSDITKKIDPPSSEKRCRSIMIGIYGLRCKTTDKWYIGQSRNIYDRWRSYKCLYCKKQIKLHNALLKYGYEDFEKGIIELCDTNTPRDVLDLKETIWIKHFNSVEHGYKCTYGGSYGKFSKESKQRTKEAQQKRRKETPVSDLTRQKLRIAGLGKKHSEKTILKMKENRRKFMLTDEYQKIKISMIGKPFSEGRKQKIRDSINKLWTEERKQKFREKTNQRLLNPEYKEKLKQAGLKGNRILHEQSIKAKFLAEPSLDQLLVQKSL